MAAASVADAVLVCDMSFYAPGIPAVYTALRGLCYAEISVRTLDRDLHSGSYGGVAPNALETLVRILSELKDEDGLIQIPKMYKAVEEPAKSERKTWSRPKGGAIPAATTQRIQTCSGSWADFPTAPQKSSSGMNDATTAPASTLVARSLRLTVPNAK